jgi:hypothetical protein
LQTSVAALCAAIQWAAERRVDIVNLSLRSEGGAEAEPLYHACEMAASQGVVLVASALPDGSPCFPAWFDNTLGVTYGDFDDPFRFDYLPDGPVELRASSGIPGKVIWPKTCAPEGNHASFAAAVISGIVCLVRERYPRAGLEEMRQLLAELAAMRPRSAATEAARAS